MWNKKYSGVKTYRVGNFDEAVNSTSHPVLQWISQYFQGKRESCVHWEGGRSSMSDRELAVYLAKFMALVEKNCGPTHTLESRSYSPTESLSIWLLVVYWKMAGGSRDSVADSPCCGAVSTGTVYWSSVSGELCAESASTAWKAKLEGVNVEGVETMQWGGGEEEERRGWTCEKQR
ncbi:hypothetical protein B0H14DRAFT_3640676 [Mycena olivaceomarginata]|nr:hypothetical protein B0H14DRAFT_3640676 [Mycena olivaceomarginata]